MHLSIIQAEETYAMLGSSDVWDTARDCANVLRQHGLPVAVVGGVAVCLHGYRRNTVDVDMLVRREDATAVRETLEQAGYVWNQDEREFIGSTGVPVQFLLSGEPAGDDSSYGVYLPDPSEPKVTTELEELPVVSLSRLIALKLACGLGNVRRTYRDLADVVELIAANRLGRDFARHLPKSLRKEFRELVLRARGGR